MQELQALYGAFSTGKPSPLPDLEFQFADYAAWQRQVMESEYKDLQLAYWRERLKDAPQHLALPTDHPRPAHKSYRGASIQRIFDGSFYRRIKAFSLREGYTLFQPLQQRSMRCSSVQRPGGLTGRFGFCQPAHA
jgi:hypothetical protein